MFLERQTKFTEKCVSLLICLCCSHESDFHSENLGDLVDVDLREDELLLHSESVVALSVHLLGNSVEVPDTREGDADEPLEELVHLGVTESHLHANRHSLTELEVGDVLP